MLQLAAEDGLTPGVPAQRLGVRPPTITKTILRLQEAGFVAKRAPQSGQRQSHIYLTQAGLEPSRQSRSPFTQDRGKDMLKGLDKKDHKTFLKMMLSRMEAILRFVASMRLAEEAETESAGRGTRLNRCAPAKTTF